MARRPRKSPTTKATAPKPATKAPATGLTKAQLIRAAELRGEGATWNAIRAEFGVKHGSSTFFRLWKREGIDHIPAGQRIKPEREPAADVNGGEA